jgi:hypothetical protein
VNTGESLTKSGASIRDPEEHGLMLPSMNNLPDVVGLHGCLSHFPQELIQDNFEATYSNIVEHDPDNPYLKVMNDFLTSSLFFAIK